MPGTDQLAKHAPAFEEVTPHPHGQFYERPTRFQREKVHFRPSEHTTRLFVSHAAYGRVAEYIRDAFLSAGVRERQPSDRGLVLKFEPSNVQVGKTYLVRLEDTTYLVRRTDSDELIFELLEALNE